MLDRYDVLANLHVDWLEQWFLNWGARKCNRGGVRDDKLFVQ